MDRVIGKMLTKKSKQNTTSTVLLYSGAVPYVGKHTNKMIPAFKNVGISNNAAMVKIISKDQTEKKEEAPK